MIGLWVQIAMAATISGTVLGPDGEPIVNAFAIAYDQRLNYGYVKTDDRGQFTIDDLPPNVYRLRILPSMLDNYAEVWSPDVLYVCDGKKLDVRDIDVLADQDVNLEAGGIIHGTLVDARGVAVPDAQLIGRTLGQAGIAQSRTTTSDANGRFHLRGLPFDQEPGFGEYHVEVQVNGYPRQYLGPTYVIDDGDSWVVEPGVEAEAGDVALFDGVDVRGTVTTADGQPVAEGDVSTYSPSEVHHSAIIAGGYYEARGLPPGQLYAWALVPGWAQTYAPNLDRSGAGRPVVEGEVVENFNIALLREAPLAVQLVRDDGVPLGDVNVLAYNDDTTVGISTTSDASGNAVFSNLDAGNYTIYAYAADADGVDDLIRTESGEPRVFTAGSSSVVPVTIPKGAMVSGTITGASGPIYGASVIAINVDTQEQRIADTDLSGVYAIHGLLAGSWRLSVDYNPYCPTDLSFVDVYYPDTINPTLGGGKRLAVGEELLWDVILGPDNDQDNMDDVWEVENGLDPLFADGEDDNDGDGYSNLDEFRLGTDPMDAGVDPKKSCGCSGDQSSAALGAVAGLWWRRRRYAATRHN